MTIRLRHVFLFTQKINAMADFYVQRVGIPQRSAGIDSVWLDTGDVAVVIHEAEGTAGEAEGPSSALLWFEVTEDLLEVRRRLASRGVTGMSEVKEGSDRRLLYLRDPGGFHIGLFQSMRPDSSPSSP